MRPVFFPLPPAPLATTVRLCSWFLDNLRLGVHAWSAQRDRSAVRRLHACLKIFAASVHDHFLRAFQRVFGDSFVRLPWVLGGVVDVTTEDGHCMGKIGARPYCKVNKGAMSFPEALTTSHVQVLGAVGSSALV